MRTKPGMAIPAIVLGLLLLIGGAPGAHAERRAVDRWGMEKRQVQLAPHRMQAARLQWAQFGRGGRARMREAGPVDHGGANRRGPGDRLSPEERDRLRRAIREQGREVYGKRPPAPPPPPPPRQH
jgi:hypothetical protein